MTHLMLTTKDILYVLKGMISDLQERSEELRELDAIIGDGDLGVTVKLGSKDMLNYLDSVDEDDIGKLLTQCGLRFNKASPSTFGTLLASAFMGAGKASLGKKEINVKDLHSLGTGAIDGINKRSKAKVGDKTMLDALVPAVEAFQRELDNGNDSKVALEAAVKAAQVGVESTIGMEARHGRAGWHREKSVGVPDGGATAVYYIIESFSRHLTDLFPNSARSSDDEF
jgi:dihydroxyacetone kinase-like protein